MDKNSDVISQPRQRTRIPELGEKFGRLIVIGHGISRQRKSQRSKPYIPVRCECGTETEVLAYQLVKGRTRSCGCLHLETIHAGASLRHGEKKTRLYQSWTWMRTRCNNPNRVQSKDYIDRGIRHCDEWNHYENFRDWARTNGYQDGLSLERIDVNGNYEPGNCKWIPLNEQCKNKRNSLLVTAFGETKIARDWTKDPRCAIGWRALYWRLKNGWNPEDAILIGPYSKK